MDLEKPQIQKKKSEAYGLGRNVNLFEDLRQYAYRTVLNFKNIHFREIRKRTTIKGTGLKHFLQSTKPVTIQRDKSNS